MSKYLISTVETYRVDTESQVKELIEEAKTNPYYELSKYTSQKKEKTQKGEIVDEWFRVTLTKIFENEKEPCMETSIEYKAAATVADKESFEITDED